MNEAANVRSLDAIREFRLAVVKFKEQASHALSAVNVEIARTLDWLSHDQLKYWKEEVRRREDRVNEAKMDLHRCQLSKNAAGETPACTDQKVALTKAKKRLAEAEEKIETIRKWCQIIEHEISEYRGPSQQLAGALDAKFPQAINLLDRKLTVLEQYVNTAPPEAAPIVESAAQPLYEQTKKPTPAAPQS
jgi:chromosome segregation ATPase